jgi:sec-independent protein translocase protein TatC
MPPSGRGHRAEDGGFDFWRHLEDLRKAMFWSVVGWVAAAAVAYEYWAELWKLLLLPMEGIKNPPKIIVTNPTGAVTMSFQIALVAGSFFAAPWILWQVWRFIQPALHVRERKIAMHAIWWITFLFAFGAVCGYFTVFPMTIKWLAEYGGGMFDQMWTVDEYTAMSVKLIGGFAAMFEFPLLTWVLASMGLFKAKDLWRWSRGAIVLIFILAAVLTPPDPVSQCIMAAPMLILYFTGVGTAWLARRKAN